jgi:ectoine hydroxylase-related dioxygenase (phytanoyl-CoA dioxygenase family)
LIALLSCIQHRPSTQEKPVTASSDASVSEADQEFFHREGYLVLPELIEPDYNTRIKAELDELVEHRAAKDHRLIVTYPEMGKLTSHPPIIERLQELMGPRFAMHHIHSARHEAGNGGVNWHQDYEQYPQTNRSHIMVHIFYYLSGLDGTVGDLLVLPKSQKIIVPNGGMGLFGTADLPGSLVVDELQPGSAIIVHSALWHARRPKPGGKEHPRYFIDVSYCQHGVLWPAYRHTDEINNKALQLGLGRDGAYDFLYDSEQFFDRRELDEAFKARNEGSIALQMKGVGENA